jgi:hypothetical protein
MSTVNGPVSSTDTAIARWNGTAGDTIQNSTVTIDGSGNFSGVAALNNGAAATTQSQGDNSTKIATTAYVDTGLTLDGLSNVRYDTTTDHNLIVGRKITLAAGAQHNVFVGELAGATAANSTSATIQNVAVGYNSLAGLTSGSGNIAMGFEALLNTTTGYQNVAIGDSALQTNITGHDNTAVGLQALFNNIDGYENSAFGRNALEANTSGNLNCALGYFALENSATGSHNVAVGDNTGTTVSSGSNNILIGHGVDVPSDVSNYLNIGNAITGDVTTGPALMNGFTGTTQSSGDSSTKIATTAFVQNVVGAITAGLDSRPSCRVATTAALTATYSNGSSGVGATLTNSGTKSAISIDGVALSTNDRVLVKNQATAAQNGIYTVTTVGSGSVNWVLTRATDFNTASGTGVVEGAFTIIEEGTSNVGSLWIETGAGPFTIGTTAITFTQLQVTNAPLPATPTYQYLLSGSAATYTTPANCRAIHVEFIAGGGGGSGSGSTPGAGGNGGDTIFNSVHAKGGSGAAAATGGTSPVGAGGTGGTGSATLRIAGGDGGGGNDSSSTNPNGPGGAGGMGVFGGGGLGMLVAAGKAGKTNTGGGGGGGGTGANASTSGGGGGGAGEYVILDITSPAATYTYTVGAAGSAGTVGGGSNPFAGAAGGTGFIRVTEYY